MHKLFIVVISFLSLHVSGQKREKPLVFHMKVTADIDPRTNRYTKLGLREANKRNVDYVILELDTYGGALTDADDIRTRILNFEKPIYAFINRDAASAGALISIACDSIYMTSGSSIGAATVVGKDGAVAPDKYQSYMRSIMRSTAEATGRNPKLAEAMVDEDIHLDSIATEGKVLTLSVSEAIKYGFCEAKVVHTDDIMKRSGVASYEMIEFNPGTSEKIISFFLNPMISGTLILIIIGGLYFELQTPGVGFPILASIVAVVLYFIPHYLNGLAENWEIAVFLLGIVLIALEVFVIPGFGVAGILGLACTLGSLVLVTIDNDYFDFSFVAINDIFIALATVSAGIVGVGVLLLVVGSNPANGKLFERVALQNTQDSAKGFTSKYVKESMIGKKGMAYTVLRPGGKIEIDGSIYDAFTPGNYIDAGVRIIVIAEEGTSLKVREDVAS